MKPRLTAKVLRGDQLNGDLAHDVDDVQTAFQWVRAMLQHREDARIRGPKSKL